MALSWKQPTSVTGTTSGVTIPNPPGTVNGNVIAAFCFGRQITAAGFTAPDATWTKWFDQPVAVGGYTLMLSAFSKIASGEPPSWTFAAACTASCGAAVAIFDDGGAAVDVDVVGRSSTTTAGNYAAPAITPSGSADPYELVIGCWASVGNIGLPAIGAALFTGIAGVGASYADMASVPDISQLSDVSQLSVTPNKLAASIYPVARGTPISPIATGGGAVWLAAQISFRTLGPSPQRRMVRGISPKLGVSIPVPANATNGDLMFAMVRSTSSAVSAPGGWTLLTSSADGLYALYSRTAASEPASYSFTNAAHGAIAVFLDMDGAAMAVDTTAAAVDNQEPSGILYTTPPVVVARNSSIVISHFAASVTVFGPYGQSDAGGVHLDYATQSDQNNMVSWALQSAAGLAARRTGYGTSSGAWATAQMAIQGIDLPILFDPDLFPELPGISWSLLRQPEAGLTVIQRSQSGKEARWSLRPPGRPIWQFTLTYEVLRANRGVNSPMYGQYTNIAQVANAATLFDVDNLTENEYAILAGFFLRQAGSGIDFYYEDLNDCTAGLFQFGRGDGITTAWTTNFTSTWQAQFPSAPLLFTDRAPGGTRGLNSFGSLSATWASNGVITPATAPKTGQPLYITAPTSSYSGHPLLGEQFAVGDGNSTQFQLVRWFGGMQNGVAEPIQNLNGVPMIWVNGIQQAPIVGTTGVVTFSSAPGRGAVLSWAGKFYWRCHFTQDTEQWDEFSYNLYNLKKIDLTSRLL